MRHAFLTFEFPPVHGGGLSTYLIEVLRMLRASGDHAFVIVTDNGVAEWKHEIFEGFDVIRVNVVNQPISRTMGYWAAASYVLSDDLARAIGIFGRPDIVEVCDGFGLGYFTVQRKLTLESPFRDLRIAVCAHTPCALIDHWEGRDWHALPRYWVREAEMACLKAADIVFSPSQFLANELRRDFECHDVNFSIVRNPYEPASLQGDAACLGLMPDPGERPFYVFGSRLAVWKGALDVARAFDLYLTCPRRSGPPVK